MTQPEGPLAGGAVPVPNALFDEWLPLLSDTEARVILVTIRATLGWRQSGGSGYRSRDWLSHAYLCRRTGRQSEAVSRAIQGLVGRGLLTVEDAAGTPLATADMRRRSLSRLYFRLGPVWTTVSRCHPAQPKTTTYRGTYKANGAR